MTHHAQYATADATAWPETLEGVRAGSAAACEALVRALRPLVHRLVHRHLPRREAEEDLQQLVFMKIFQKLDRYEPRVGIPFEHWVSRLTVRTCLDALRAEKSRPVWTWTQLTSAEQAWGQYLLEGSAVEMPDDASSGRDAAHLLELLLSHLPPTDRLVLTLLDLEEKSTADIASLTGWTRAGIKMRAMRARHRLQRIAREKYAAEFAHSSSH